MKKKEIKSVCGSVFFMVLLQSILSNPLRRKEFEINELDFSFEEENEENLYADIARRVSLYEPYITEIGEEHRFPGEHNSDD